MSEQLRRQIEILRTLPKAGFEKSTSELMTALKSAGFRCSKRTIERDLELLADMFPQTVACNEGMGENGRTNYWYLKSGKVLLPETLLGNNDIALALALLKQQAFSRLPSRIFNLLNPLWEQATATAAENPVTRKWLQFTRYKANPLRPEAPELNNAVQDVIEAALLADDALTLTVATLDGEMTYEKTLPMRLLQREEIMFLLAENLTATTVENTICLIPIHRILTASSKLSLDGGSGIDPDMAEDYALGFGDTLQLKLHVTRPLAESMFERPVGRGQVITADPENADKYYVTTTIEDSPQLQRWLKRCELNRELVVVPAT